MQSISALCAAGGVPATMLTFADAELVGGTDGVGILVQCIHIFGPEPTAAEILTQSQRGPVDALSVRRELRRELRRSKRNAQAANRRERHAGNEVLYRGPLAVPQVLSERIARSESRRIVSIVTTDEDLYVRDEAGIVPMMTIPAGSRLLFDMRRGRDHETWACEVVRTRGNGIRVHLWQGATAYQTDLPTVPTLRGGCVYESPAAPRSEWLRV